MLDKIAVLIMFVSMSMLDSDTYIPFIVCAISAVWLLVRTLTNKIDL